ncbi:MAG: hypothetical protein E5X80_08385 [Mesorhizobium sp.]|nr:MAG: hypothetical protein EOR71_17910 [Mesorhizobium sp.]TIO53890.1 MAG: hypothetical protein E5X78_05925 [Mesorhizobium sp.]TIO61517.1 MAG: hypothetical protein E5X79_07070 [Mesorhizobium sp.]TJV65903.1 MAG: hypothetical protein E5X80_08385 [Mesorhizobium sp.]
MEARTADALPEGNGSWQYEPKWNGFRCLAFKAAGPGAAPMRIRTNRRNRDQSALAHAAVIASAVIPELSLEREQVRIRIFSALDRRRDDLRSDL